MNNGNPFWMGRTSEPLEIAGWVPNRDETPGGVPYYGEQAPPPAYEQTPPPTPAAIDPFLATMGHTAMREAERGPSPRGVPQFGVEFSSNGEATGYFEGKPFELLDPASWMELLIESYRLEREHTFARILTEVQQESRTREAVLKGFESRMVSNVLPEPSGNDEAPSSTYTGRDMPTMWNPTNTKTADDLLPMQSLPSAITGRAPGISDEQFFASRIANGGSIPTDIDLLDESPKPRNPAKARPKAARRPNKPKRRVPPGKHSTPSIQSE